MSTINLAPILAILGSENILTDEQSRRQSLPAWSPMLIKSRQQGHEAPLPEAVLRPAGTDELKAIIEWATTAKISLRVMGGNTGGSGPHATTDSGHPVYLTVDLARMNAVRWDEESLLVTAGAGCRLGDLETQLNQHQYTLGQFPQTLHQMTVGGAVSTNAIGLLSGRYGRIADAVQDLEIMLPSGEMIHTAAVPGLKSYYNLDNLFIGVQGAFGIVTEATLALYPVPEVRAFGVFSFEDLNTAIDAARLVYRSDARPAALRIFDSAASVDLFACPTLLIMGFEGDELVQTGNYQLAYAVCQTAGGTPQSPEIGDTWWERRQDVQWFAANAQMDRIILPFTAYAPWSVIKPAERAMRDALTPATEDLSLQICHLTPHGAALEWRCAALFGGDSPDLLYDALFTAGERCLDAGGAPLHHYPIDPFFQHFAGTSRQMSVLRVIKSAIDPNALLNRGTVISNASFPP